MTQNPDQPDLQFSGLVISTHVPVRLAAWYRSAFAPDAEDGDLIGRPLVVVGGARLFFDRRDDVASAPAEPGRVLINLYVADIGRSEARLDQLGVTWVRSVEHVEGLGSIGTLADADGNLVQILHPERR